MAPPDKDVPPEEDGEEPLPGAAVSLAPALLDVDVAPVDEAEGELSGGQGSPGESWNLTSARAAFWVSSVKFSFY